MLAARHGRTAWNLAGRLQGHADPDLDAEGRAQAERLAVELAGLPVGRVVASDLRRARHTARPVARALGLALIVDPRLREVDVGAWEGLTPAEIAEAFPAEHAAWRSGEGVAVGGGESVREAGARVAGAIVEHAADLGAGQTLVVVSHGTALRSALRWLRAEGIAELDGDPPRLANASWVELTLRVGLSGSGSGAPGPPGR